MAKCSSSASQQPVSTVDHPVKDPRKIARKYQLMLCQKAVEENVIVYLGTGCGKTHIAVLLIYELGHLIRKPQKEVCVFLAPTVHLVRQQAMVIQDCTDFNVGNYYSSSKRLKTHSDWEKEIKEHEVLVMTPQILLRNLEHCFIRMETIAILIFDECHHAQTQNRHPYAQIMKEFYKTDAGKCPRIFGMTASPVVGKGGSNQESYSKELNSLEHLLNAKIYSIEDKEALESIVASPNVMLYYYDYINHSSSCIKYHRSKLLDIKARSMAIIRENIDEPRDLQKAIKLLWRLHENLLFCLEDLGLNGLMQAVCVLRKTESGLSGIVETEGTDADNLKDLYLNQMSMVFDFDFIDDGLGCKSNNVVALEEPLFSNKLLALISLLSTYGSRPDIKCIVFVKRVIIARSLAFILRRLQLLSFWRCHYLVGMHSGQKNMSRNMMNGILEKFRSGEFNLLVATNVAEEGLDIQTCCLVVRFDPPETLTSFIQSRGRARMSQSEYVFLVRRGNEREINMIKDFMSNEEFMNTEIAQRSSGETFDSLEEKRYKIDSTGASISTASSVDLLHHYCSKLPRDEYFTPMPVFSYFDDLNGTRCRITLPSNAPIRQVDGSPCPSKDEAKRTACLKACTELHSLGALTDYLLPCQDGETTEGLDSFETDEDEADEILREELHEMLIPAALQVPWSITENVVCLYAYFIQFIPHPHDRVYRPFGLFIKNPLPEEAETMDIDLHLMHGRIVNTTVVPSGIVKFYNSEIIQAEKFQEMFLKVVLDREEFCSDFVPLGKNVRGEESLACYLLLPVKKLELEGKITVDWETITTCLSSPLFRCPADVAVRSALPVANSLEFINGTYCKDDIPSSLVLMPHNRLLFFVVDIIHDMNANSPFKDSTYAEHYRKEFKIRLSHPEQPLLKAKQLFKLHNLLHNRLQENTEVREKPEHFVEFPPELCSLKIFGFSKEIGSSLSLLPSVMHHLENLLVAIELKNRLSSSFPEGSKVTANHVSTSAFASFLNTVHFILKQTELGMLFKLMKGILQVLEALTTEKCLEQFSLERLEVLGDAFLKYAVSQHLFLCHETLDEGQLTRKRSNSVNNLNLYELAIKNNLQVYIRDECFQPSNFFALGRPCGVICDKDMEKNIHSQIANQKTVKYAGSSVIKCNKNHHWLHKKTIADVVEALTGAFIVDGGFKSATAFLRWMGIAVDFEASDISKACNGSTRNLSLSNKIDIASLEALIGHRFQSKGLLLQAFIHPSYNKHSGGCYQRLEFLGDAVLDYLITSYLFSAYPDLKPGQLTDLRSMTVNNNSFAHVAVSQSFHSYLISDSASLLNAIEKFVDFLSASEKNPNSEPKCPKVLGDLVESCAGAVLLDTRFDLKLVWRIIFNFLDPIMSFSHFQLTPIRELQELCQCLNFQLTFASSKSGRIFTVEAIVNGNNESFVEKAINSSRKAATRMAAREVLSRMKAKGFKLKGKSMEEILQSSRKNEPALIGYDETEELQVQDEKAASSSTASNCKALGKESLVVSSDGHFKTQNAKAVPSITDGNCSTNSKVLGQQPDLAQKSTERHLGEASGDSDCSPTLGETSSNGNCDLEKQTSGVTHKGSAKSRLYEICAANYWNPPLFECFYDEGPSHLKMFAFKVTVEMEAATTTLLECFGDARPKKKSAEEHAAEGALWYLRHQGY